MDNFIIKKVIMKKSNSGFSWGKGNFYFTIKDSPRNITMFRKDKSSALYTYDRYVQEGKDVEWLGQWDGKKFIETQVSELADK